MKGSAAFSSNEYNPGSTLSVPDADSTALPPVNIEATPAGASLESSALASQSLNHVSPEQRGLIDSSEQMSFAQFQEQSNVLDEPRGASQDSFRVVKTESAIPVLESATHGIPKKQPVLSKGRSRNLNSFRALLLKTFAYERHKILSNVFLILILPIVVAGFCYMAKSIIKVPTGSRNPTNSDYTSSEEKIDCRTNSKCELWTPTDSLGNTNRGTESAWFIVGEPKGVNLGWKGTDHLSHESTNEGFSFRVSGESFGFLGNFPPGSQAKSSSIYPAFAKVSGTSKAEFDQHLYKAISNRNVSQKVAANVQNLATKKNTEFDLLKFKFSEINEIQPFPWGVLHFSIFNPASSRLHLTMQVGDDDRNSEEDKNNKGKRLLITSGMVTNAFLSNVTNNKAEISQGFRVMPIFVPKEKRKNHVLMSSLPLFLTLALSSLLPGMVNVLVQDKENRIFQMMLINGVSPTTYFLANWVHLSVLGSASALVTVVANIVVQVELFQDPAVYVSLVVLMLWVVVQSSLAVFLSTFFSKARTAHIVTSILLILPLFAFEGVGYVLNRKYPILLALWPPFGLQIVLIGICHGVFGDLDSKYTFKELFASDSQAGLSLLLLFVMTAVLLILSYYCHKVLPKEFGVTRPWHFPISDLIAKISSISTSKNQSSKRSVQIVNAEEANFESEDVKKERQIVAEIAKSHRFNECPLVLENMRKIYPNSSKVAVEDVSFAVQNSTIFGLLGPNGAGKTSLINILCGMYSQTFGTAHIAGFDTVKACDQACKVVGVCPQHDIFWPVLTVEEHLLFHARVKGCARKDESAAVQTALESVQLTELRKKIASKLSGGERRRLSIAIALIGNPKVLFLDEPTTGLDPEVRRDIWEIIQCTKKDRTVVLTTHSMEEAEALCGKIGIMAQGSLRCIGPVLRLKEVHSKGFKLTIQAQPHCMPQAREWIEKQVLPRGSQAAEVFDSKITYEFVPEAGDLAKVFLQMQSESKAHYVEDWGLSQSSLEDVFLQIVSEADADGRA